MKSTSERCAGMLCYIADRFEEQKQHLTDLDSAIGDGDLGVTMTLGFRAIRNASPSWGGKMCDEILRDCAILFSNYAPSTIGALFSTGFLRASAVIAGKSEVDGFDIIAMLEASVEGIQQRGNASLGDKTMLDALLPAIEAVKEIDPSDLSVGSVLEKGAENTKDLKASQGRSRWLQDRTIGHIDPGAEAVATLLRACTQFLSTTSSNE
jgi:dihydroxyacetone kinase-like protein